MSYQLHIPFAFPLPAPIIRKCLSSFSELCSHLHIGALSTARSAIHAHYGRRRVGLSESRLMHLEEVHISKIDSPSRLIAGAGGKCSSKRFQFRQQQKRSLNRCHATSNAGLGGARSAHNGERKRTNIFGHHFLQFIWTHAVHHFHIFIRAFLFQQFMAVCVTFRVRTLISCHL